MILLKKWNSTIKTKDNYVVFALIVKLFFNKIKWKISFCSACYTNCNEIYFYLHNVPDFNYEAKLFKVKYLFNFLWTNIVRNIWLDDKPISSEKNKKNFKSWKSSIIYHWCVCSFSKLFTHFVTHLALF